MGKYRKSPIVIDAFRYKVHPEPEWFVEAVNLGNISVWSTMCFIKTLEGKMRCDIGDWIIRGIDGELYPCKNDIFIKTYEAVDDKDSPPA